MRAETRFSDHKPSSECREINVSQRLARSTIMSYEDPSSREASISTGGGSYIEGGVNSGAGHFVCRDNAIQGDAVDGDKVEGDKITTGDIDGVGIAIGTGNVVN